MKEIGISGEHITKACKRVRNAEELVYINFNGLYLSNLNPQLLKKVIIEETCKWLKKNICTAKTYTDEAGMQFTVEVDEVVECYRKEMERRIKL